MINQKLAFNRYTTSKHLIQDYIPGRYDEDNNWVEESWGEPRAIRCTPIGYGDRDSGTTGQQLKATDVGERQPAFMQVHSRREMPINSMLTIYKIRYKVIQINDYSDAGFYRVICARELEK
ncbi:head protein [Proteus phage Myduc]|uniref:Head-tail adaptor protein n=1 Tax=Proteus phage Myduc TaxID=2650874 RepID=A0A5J6T8F7_9CAUD|nr:head protein [Proteus phage Myduc]QFG06682.1 hypothetical protein CPT_Myduc_060 [Proteus phage Myduc]